MSRNELLEVIKEILLKHAYADDNQVIIDAGENTNLTEDLNIDSLDVINIIVDIENRFSIEVSNDEIKKIVLIKDCIDIIEDKIK
jgi:acyl carrier protein